MTQETSSKKDQQAKKSSLELICTALVLLVYLVTFLFVAISLPIIPVLVVSFLYKVSIGTTILFLHCILLLSSIRYLNMLRIMITPLRPKIEYYCLTNLLIRYKKDKWFAAYYKDLRNYKTINDIFAEKSKSMRKKRAKMLKTVPRKMKELNVKINKTGKVTIKLEYISLLWKHAYHSHPNNILLALIIFFAELQPIMIWAPVLAIEFEVDNKMVAYGCLHCRHQTWSHHLFACHQDYAKCMIYFEFYRQIYIEVLNKDNINFFFAGGAWVNNDGLINKNTLFAKKCAGLDVIDCSTDITKEQEQLFDELMYGIKE